MAFNWDQYPTDQSSQTTGPLIGPPAARLNQPGYTTQPVGQPVQGNPVTLPPGFGASAGTAIGTALGGTPPAASQAQTQDFGNLSDPATWMALVRNPARLREWVKANNPGWPDQLIDYYVGKIQGQPGANEMEQRGSAQYWLNEKMKKDPFYGGGAAGAGGYAAPGYGDLSQMDTAQFSAPNLIDDPGYQFRLSEGLKGIERSAAAKGTLLTGGTLKALAGYHQGLASQEYGNAWDRAMGQFTTNYGVRKGERGDLFDRYYRTSTLGKPE